MDTLTDPIFVFTDDLSVHRSFADAASYHEHRSTLLAFNRNGDAFEIPPFPESEPVRHLGNRKKEFLRRLRRELILFAIARPELLQMSKWDVKHATEDEIIRLAMKWCLVPDPPPREHRWQFWRPRRT